jgi:hypothetical protein
VAPPVARDSIARAIQKGIVEQTFQAVNDELLQDLKASVAPGWRSVRLTPLIDQELRGLSGLRDAFIAHGLSNALKYVDHRCQTEARPTLATVVFDRMNLTGKMLLYWREIDDLVHHAHVAVFEVARARMMAALSNAADPVTSSMHIRQLVEISFWAVFYQFGVTSAFNLAYREFSDQHNIYLESKDIEDFVRGAFAISPGRATAVRRFSGAEELSKASEGWVAEITATVAKQHAVCEHVAAEPRFGKELDLPARVARLFHIYKYACALVHVTPAMLQVGTPAPGQDDEFTKGHLDVTANGIRDCAVLLDNCFFHERYDSVRFLPWIASVAPAPTQAPSQAVSYNVPFLQNLKRNNDHVILKFVDGAVLPIYGKGPPL